MSCGIPGARRSAIPVNAKLLISRSKLPILRMRAIYEQTAHDRICHRQRSPLFSLGIDWRNFALDLFPLGHALTLEVAAGILLLRAGLFR